MQDGKVGGFFLEELGREFCMGKSGLGSAGYSEGWGLGGFCMSGILDKGILGLRDVDLRSEI